MKKENVDSAQLLEILGVQTDQSSAVTAQCYANDACTSQIRISYTSISTYKCISVVLQQCFCIPYRQT